MHTATQIQTDRASKGAELQNLVARLRQRIGSAPNWADAAEGVAAELRENDPAIRLLTEEQQRVSPGEAAGHRLHVEPDGSFSVIAIAWGRDQWTRIHDHVTWCVFAGLRGEVTERLYELDASSEVLAEVGERVCTPSTVRCELPPGDIHCLGNTGPKPAITLHVYGTDVDRLGTSARRYYDLPTERNA